MRESVAAYPASSCGVESVEPSSMTTNSRSESVWARMLSIASRKKRSPLYTDITTETAGTAAELVRTSSPGGSAPVALRGGLRLLRRNCRNLSALSAADLASQRGELHVSVSDGREHRREPEQEERVGAEPGHAGDRQFMPLEPTHERFVPEEDAVRDQAAPDERPRLEHSHEQARLRPACRKHDHGQEARERDGHECVVERVTDLLSDARHPGRHEVGEQAERYGRGTHSPGDALQPVLCVDAQDGESHPECEEVRMTPEASLDDRLPVGHPAVIDPRVKDVGGNELPG